MSTLFASLPIIDLSLLKAGAKHEEIPRQDVTDLSNQLRDIFATTGFAYLTNAPLSFSHEHIFEIAKEFFGMPDEEKMALAKKMFEPTNNNTYRGYFPTQPLMALDNLKEGFEMGPTKPLSNRKVHKIKPDLSEPNVWPDAQVFKSREMMEKLYNELQTLAAQLLSLIAVSLGKRPDFFDNYLEDSLSTLRLLHYPVSSSSAYAGRSSSTLDSFSDSGVSMSNDEVKLSCTPHTDSGILTLLHQDSTGGLEVRNAAGHWVPAPYLPGSIVVNIGDLMAEVSGGRFVATVHRVRAPPVPKDENMLAPFGRFSVPFFFEPGENCVVRAVDDDDGNEGIVYGEHVRAKMKTWVEFQEEDEDEEDDEKPSSSDIQVEY